MGSAGMAGWLAPSRVQQQINHSVVPRTAEEDGNHPRRTAARRAFVVTTPVTQRDVSIDVARCSPPTRRSVPDPEVIAGPRSPSTMRANVPAAGGKILPDLTRAVCGR